MTIRILVCSSIPPTNIVSVRRQKMTMANSQCMAATRRGFGTRPSLPSPADNSIYHTIPHLTSWPPWKAISGRRLSAAATDDMELEVLDP